jgi:DNA invertase Pin-like site-specific DNA recombinase
MPVAAYLRVSSRSQTIETQRATIERVAKNRGDTIAEWFSETESGRKLDRPVLTRLRSCVREGAFSRVYVFRLDRLTRSGIRDTLAVVEEFQERGCQLVSIADPFDLTSPVAPVIISVLAWAAEQERRAIGDRVHEARKRIEAKGGAWGRPRAAIPMAQLQRAASMVRDGRSIRSVAIQMGICRSTLIRNLSWLAQKGVTQTGEVTPQNRYRGK